MECGPLTRSVRYTYDAISRDAARPRRRLLRRTARRSATSRGLQIEELRSRGGSACHSCREHPAKMKVACVGVGPRELRRKRLRRLDHPQNDKVVLLTGISPANYRIVLHMQYYSVRRPKLPIVSPVPSRIRCQGVKLSLTVHSKTESTPARGAIEVYRED